jgi:hypothetical protein
MSEVKNELSTRCPVVNNILSVLLDISHNSEKKEPALCLIYGIIMLDLWHYYAFEMP